MGTTYKHIILVTDALQSACATTQTVLDLARQHNSKVTIVDSVRPPSTATRLFSSNAKDVFEMVLADKEQRLEKVAVRFREGGIAAESKLLFGKSSEQIVRLAIDSNADLVVRYMKGLRSRFPGLFGNTARNLMRICPCSLLLVGDKPIENPKVLACVNAEHAEDENKVILSEAKRLAQVDENLVTIFCWKLYGDEYLKEYWAENTFQATLDESERLYEGIFEKFIEQYSLQSVREQVRLEQGDPCEVIPEFCRNESIDVVVMSSASQAHPIRRLLGSTIESVIEKLPCSLLVVKPLGFESPVQPTDETLEAGN